MLRKVYVCVCLHVHRHLLVLYCRSVKFTILDDSDAQAPILNEVSQCLSELLHRLDVSRVEEVHDTGILLSALVIIRVFILSASHAPLPFLCSVPGAS